MLLENINRRGCQPDAPAAFFSFRLGLNISLTRSASEDATHLKCLLCKVNVSPFETCNLTSTHTPCYRKDKQCFIWVSLHSFNKPLWRLAPCGLELTNFVK